MIQFWLIQYLYNFQSVWVLTKKFIQLQPHCVVYSTLKFNKTGNIKEREKHIERAIYLSALENDHYVL